MEKRKSPTACLSLFFIYAVIAPMLLGACSHLHEGSAGSTFREASDLFSRGSYKASLSKYEQVLERHPDEGDRALFEMGIIHAYPSNEQKDYPRALECFQRVMKDYPGSPYRQNSAEMISHITTTVIKDKKIIALQAQVGNLEQELRNRENEIVALQKKVETLDRELKSTVLLTQNGPASRVLIEKKERKLTLLSKDKVLKSYRIALGGNPNGPKERRGDNKTPEGTYIINARNRDSRYHLSLQISYPNEKDKKRAKELGVPPGGNVMIHGLKNGFSWVGDAHAALDWTEGCIAVTNEEIEEIARLVPNGTAVEIKP